MTGNPDAHEIPDSDGSDRELIRILGDTYACTRHWSAWELGTMTEEDFEEAAHSPIVDDLIAWRDAAVAAALEAAGKPSAEPAEPTIGDRVTASLLEAGFRQHQPRMDAKLAAFAVAEGDSGAYVSVIWAASDEWRGKVLAKLGEALRADGFTTRPAGGHLFVPGPKRAGQDSPATATEDKP